MIASVWRPALRRWALALALCALVSPAGAQEAPPDSTADPLRGTLPGATRGASVGVLDRAAAAPTATTLADMLTARLPGVSVLRASGSAGTASRVRLRGIESIRGGGTPLVVIDGVRMDADPTTALLGVGGQQISALDDLSPEDVERVEVLRGPAAAAMYGTGAAAGVIVVTTKRASAQPFAVSAFGRVGPVSEVADFPARYWATGVDPGGSPVPMCTLYQTVESGCTQNPLLIESSPAGQSVFRSGSSTAFGGSASGSLARVDFRASASADRDAGTLAENDARRLHLRADVRPRLHSSLDVRLSGGHTRADRSLPLNDNLVVGVLSAALGRWPAGAPTNGPDYQPELAVAGGLDQESARTTFGADAEWRARPWLRVRATAGQDRASRDAVEVPPVFEAGTGWTIGPHRSTAGGDRVLTTLRGVISGDWRRGSRLTLGGDAGVEHIRLEDDREERFELDGILTSGSERHAEVEMTEPMARLRAGWADRLFASVGVRRGDAPDDRHWYPSADVSWAIGGAYARGWLSDVRLRAAYGEVAGAEDPDSMAALGFAGALRAERVREVEAGADARIGGRVSLGITAYRQETRGLLLPRLTGTPSGEQLANVGDMRNQGLEVALRARALDRPAFSLELGIVAAVNDAEVVRLEGPPYVSTLGRVQEGESPWAFWALPYSFADANGDGIIALAEITPAASSQFAGESVAPRELGAEVVARVGFLTLAALLDHRGGHRQVNHTRSVLCNRGVCEELYRLGSSLADQARYRMSGNGSFYGYIERADFTRLRELSLGAELPSAWTRRLGGARTRLTVAARNVATWTAYRGLDPETTFNPANAAQQHELWTQPLPRSVAVRLDVGR
ncbi:MAG TPA: TonB-dependent receptor [Gemmatimonadaceae bacterium]|nr:TonB-dependent receptor [Gemmatimonadaceae bacterium]